MRFDDAVIQEAMAKCGNAVHACVDFCLARTAEPLFDSAVGEAEQFEAAEAFLQLGFSETAATRALEETNFSFPKTLQLLLYGNDVVRWKGIDADKRSRRHLRKRVPQIGGLSTASVWQQYTARANQDMDIKVRVVDLDQLAGPTTAACFCSSFRISAICSSLHCE